jgi:hypothetical protein
MLAGDPTVETPCGDSKVIVITPEPVVVGGVIETLKN